MSQQDRPWRMFACCETWLEEDILLWALPGEKGECGCLKAARGELQPLFYVFWA